MKLSKLKTSFHSKHVKIIGGLGLIVVVLMGVAAYRFFAISPEEAAVRKVYDQMKSAEIAPSAVDPSLQVEVNKYMGEGNYEEAKRTLEKILQNSNLTDADKLSAHASLGSACLKLQDTSCLQRVINYNAQTNRVDIYLLKDAADIAGNKGDVAQRTRLYREVLAEINRQGGAEYVNKLNSNAQRTLDYQQISQVAGE